MNPIGWYYFAKEIMGAQKGIGDMPGPGFWVLLPIIFIIALAVGGVK